MPNTGRERDEEAVARKEVPLPGIIINGERPDAHTRAPRIAAFIWGGKVPPTPTLPYGRWRGAA